jgi:ATP-dependent exoDNAse (exonuclease V) alpha subunit
VFDPRELHAVALERTAGEMTPGEALAVAHEMIRDRRILTLEGGRMTTLAVRAQEQAIERRAAQLARPAGLDVGDTARGLATREVSERIGAPLSPEQHHALGSITGPERLGVLIGPAGTGKGVVINAAARAERHAGRQTLGIAVSGSTAERLAADSPALSGRTLTLDALVARANTGTMRVGADTTIFLDEAGMADHKRLDAITKLIERSGAKLIAVGDGKQLPAIGPGGMFDRLATHTETAELADIHRARDPAERKAWAALRDGEPERAMAHYLDRGQLHFADTRDDAGEAAIQRWRTLADKHGIHQVALIADASNQEIDRLNARAQHLRAQHGELGEREVPLPGVHYGLREGDLIAFTTQHRPPGQSRVENGARGQVTAIHEHGGVSVMLDGSARQVQLATEDLDTLRLGCAQHVYRQQGATVERSVIVTGGWQTSKETAYVEASRARKGTDWFLARDELGDHGQDAIRVRRLADAMRHSRAQTPSIAHPGLPDPGLARIGVCATAVPTNDAGGQPAGFAANCAAVQAFCRVVRRAGSETGSCTSTFAMLLSPPLPAPWGPSLLARCTWKLAPFTFDVPPAVEAVNEGWKESFEQPLAWNGVESEALIASVEMSDAAIGSA